MRGLLKAADVARELGVSIRTVHNLWTDGRLTYKMLPNAQHTRVCTPEMLEAYRRRVMRSLIG